MTRQSLRALLALLIPLVFLFSTPQAAAQVALTLPQLAGGQNQSFAVNDRVNLTMPAATGGMEPYTYTLEPSSLAVTPFEDTFPGLTFDADNNRILGVPTTQNSAGMTYVHKVRDSTTGIEATEQTNNYIFGITADVTAPVVTYTVPTRLAVGRSVTLTPTTDDPDTLTYAVDTTTPLPPGLTLATATGVISGAPTTVSAATTAVTITVTDSADNEADVQLTFPAVDEPPKHDALNRVLLPELAKAISDQATSAIKTRIEQAKRAKGKMSATVGGHSTLAGMVARHGSSLADGSLNMKNLVAGSDFSVQLGEGGSSMMSDTTTGVRSLAFWGSGNYRSLSGDRNLIEWDGDLLSLNLGTDIQLRENLLTGISVSRSHGDLDYVRESISGDYDLRVTGVHPYIAWNTYGGRLDLWATAGFGSGDLDIKEDDQDTLSSDVDMWTFAAGVVGEFINIGPAILRLKGEILRSILEVEGSDEISELEVDTTRLRLATEVTHVHITSGGYRFQPRLEIGVRNDQGDGGNGGTAVELGGGLHHSSPGGRMKIEGNTHILVGGEDEWGVEGVIHIRPIRDNRGLSFMFRPGYGETASEVRRIWQEDTDRTTAGRDYDAKVDTHLAYILPVSGGGVLTPYSEMTVGGDSRSYRVGMDWGIDSAVNLKLTGERFEEGNAGVEHALLLKGELRF